MNCYLKVFSIAMFLTMMSAKAISEDEISFIGQADNGKVIQKKLKVSEFEKRFAISLRAISKETIKEVSKEKTLTNKIWKMNKVYLGMGLYASLGLGSLIKASVAPSFYLILVKK